MKVKIDQDMLNKYKQLYRSSITYKIVWCVNFEFVWSLVCRHPKKTNTLPIIRQPFIYT
jgi:hypothetical protein